jgi:6-pyruvoyltetrahydropterin/6-carboxytetrahydropterin synthase
VSRPAQITRRLEFDYGHRLLNHEGKCRNVHGHRGVVELTCEAAELDAVGRVIDFGVVKAVVGGWLDDKLDHGYIGQAEDPILEAARKAGSKVYSVSFPPTAEHLARYLFDVASNLLGGSYQIRVVRVRLYETPNGWADYPTLAGVAS